MRNKALSVINIFLSIALVLSCLLLVRDALSFMAWKQVKKTPKAYKRTASAATGAPQEALQSYAPILKNNIFGLPEGNLTPLSGASASASASTVGLTLIGTVSGPEGFGYAIFEAEGNQDIYRSGETIAGVGKLVKVSKDKIFLASGGNVTEIAIADIAVIREVKRPEAGYRPAGFARRTSGNTFVIDQNAVTHALANPNQIMTDARLLPNIIGGKQEGFVMREVKPAGIYQSLGLRDGDVLLRVNEHNISSPEAALQAFTALRGLDRVELDILRDGSRMTMTYQIR